MNFKNNRFYRKKSRTLVPDAHFFIYVEELAKRCLAAQNNVNPTYEGIIQITENISVYRADRYENGTHKQVEFGRRHRYEVKFHAIPRHEFSPVALQKLPDIFSECERELAAFIRENTVASEAAVEAV